MINHVVLFKLKEFASDSEKEEVLNKIKSMLLNLTQYIPELKHIEVGLNHELKSSSFDLSLITHFDDLEGLNTYQYHPEHLKVGAFLKQVVVNRAAVDSIY